MAVFDVLNANNTLFCVYITWCCVLLAKTFLMTLLTVIHRFKNKAVLNIEDCALAKGLEVKSHEDIDRVRRAHLNDLENVVPFLIIGLFYILTEPHVGVACWLIRIAAVARILHTIVYALFPVRQPVRAILFYITYIISLYMTLSSVVYFFRL